MAAVRTGLTAPRVDNTEMQRFFQQVIQRLDNLAGEVSAAAAAAGTGTGTGTGAVPTAEPTASLPVGGEIPVLSQPPQPTGFDGACGIDVCALFWSCLLYTSPSPRDS